MREVARLQIKTARDVSVLTTALEELVERSEDQLRWLRTTHADAEGCIEEYEKNIASAKGLLAQVDKLLEK